LKSAAISLLESAFGGPAWELACDEALLESCEAGETEVGGILRFWEADSHFVVLGIANKAELEVNPSAEVPVFRRCSGGGSVLQGPGCLNYSLVLPIDRWAELTSITQTNCFIMKRHREAMAALLRAEVGMEGYTDLTLAGRKFSGNAQRRKSRWLLFHGTFLLHCDFGLMGRVLRPPPREPGYRKGRTHSEFLAALILPAQKIKEALCQAWDANATFTNLPHARIERLVEEKYSRREWNLRT
jgi:lipoate---protein ligase